MHRLDLVLYSLAKSFLGNEVRTLVNSKEKSPLPEAQRRGVAVPLYIGLKGFISHFCYRVDIIKQLCESKEARLTILECLLHLYSTNLSSSSCSASEAQLKASTENSRLPPETVRETLECVVGLMGETDVATALDTCWRHRWVFVPYLLTCTIAVVVMVRNSVRDGC